ncbi:MAG: TldD/PmbA family protein [Deltaproteobacteria bacterium]|nr:TldD/PmbA family protein [Deltaproteobacteria bacterium]
MSNTNFKNIFKKIKNKFHSHPKVEFELFYVYEHNLEIEVKDQKLDTFESADTYGLGLRVLKEGQLGFSYTSDFGEASLQRCVDSALQILPYAAKNESLYFQTAYALPPMDLLDYDVNFKSHPPAFFTQKAMELEKAALSYHPLIKHVRGASASATLTEICLANSLGLELNHQKTLSILSLMAVAEEGDEAESAYEFGFSPFVEKLDPSNIGEKAAKKAAAYLGGQEGKNYQGPALLDSSVVSDIFDVLAPSFYADHVFKKQSMLVDKQNQQVFSPLLTLLDNPLLTSGAGSFPFDAEGVLGSEKKLLRQGIVQDFLADKEYQRRMGLKAAGSSHRDSYKKLPHLNYSNLYLEKGELNFEKLLKKMEKGVYITELIGMHTANAVSGDFSVGAQGFWVEKGEIAYPLKQMAISGNLKRMLGSIEAVGNDLRFYFRLGTPSILLSHLDVAGA